MGERRPVKLMRGMHHLPRERGGRVPNQRDMVSKFLRVTRCRLGTGIGEQPHENDVADAVLFQLQIEIGVREPARGPMLFDDDVAVLWGEIRVPVSAPFASRKTMPFHDGKLSRAWMAPGLIVARPPPTVRHDEHPDTSPSHCAADGPQIVEKSHLGRNLFDTWPDLSFFRKEIVIG